MEDEKDKVLSSSEEFPLPVHSVFIDLSLENDLKGEELEWFKSKITQEKVQHERERKTNSEVKKVEIVVEHELDERFEKPNKVLLKLRETDTIWFLSLDTCFSQENEEDAERVRLENEAYETKKTKKEIIRKRCVADAQTPCFMVKPKESLTTEIVTKDISVFASEWDMYDTYNVLDISDLEKHLTFEGEIKHDHCATAEQVTKTFDSLTFKYASLVTERLLASNCYQDEQSVFKKDYKTRYDSGPTRFGYNANQLWSFQKYSEQPLSVTDMDWNPLNQDVLAVGYGDLNFLHDEKSSGLVCVWSSKNPCQPERQFHFEESVMSLHYSRNRPNILAVGTRTGSVYVVDVSIQEENKRSLNSEASKIHPGPIWKVEWFLHRELMSEMEDLLAVGESGMLTIFSTSIDKDPQDVLKLEYLTTRKLPGKAPGKKQSRRPTFHDEVFDKKTFSGLSFSICPGRHVCYVCTKEGVVVKCNLRNPSMTDGIFSAHDGPVYTIHHSPVSDLIYLTCGADWKVKIWMEGIYQPLICLQQKAPISCARWSPTIPTLIASIGKSELSLWDIGRNTLTPMSVKNFQDSGILCSLLFSSNGANLMVGCQDGLVRVVHLSELPRTPFLQKEALISSIRRALLRNKNDLFNKFCREVRNNKDKLKTNVLDSLDKL